MKWPDLDLDWSIPEGHYELDHGLIDRLNSYLLDVGCTCWLEENAPTRRQMGRIRICTRNWPVPGRMDWNSLRQVVIYYADLANAGVSEYHKDLYPLFEPFLPFAGVSSDEEISLKLATMGY